MQSKYLVFTFFIGQLVFATKDFPIDKKAWISQFKVYFSNEFCGHNDWLKKCPKTSESLCKDFFSQEMISSCLKKNEIVFPMKTLSSSLEAGDKTGRCLAGAFEKQYPTKEKDRSECRNLLKQISF